MLRAELAEASLEAVAVPLARDDAPDRAERSRNRKRFDRSL